MNVKHIAGLVLVAAHVAGAPAPVERPGSLPLTEGYARQERNHLRIPGLVKNLSGGWIKAVRVDVELLDAEGQVILNDRVYTTPERVAPGETAPFEYLRDVAKLARPYASHRLAVSALPATGEARLVAVQSSRRRDGPHVELRGELRSAGSAPCRSPSAVAGAFDASGRLLDVVSVFPDAPREGLAPGERAAFRLLLRDAEGVAIADVTLWGGCGGGA